MKLTFKLVMAGLTLLLLAPAFPMAQAQTCPGSHVNYIVRDEKGAVIESAWPEDFRFEDEKIGEKDYKWFSEKFKTHRATGILPADIGKLDDKAWMLSTTGWCIFETDLKLKLTRNGKTMSLLFRMPKLEWYASRDFIVDSPKFQEGSFEIVLSLPEDSSRENYFPASAWKKRSN